MNKSNVYIVGRHDAVIDPTTMTVVGSESVLFPANWEDCQPVLLDIAERARLAGAVAVVLQATPVQVAKAILKGVYRPIGVGYYLEVDVTSFGDVRWGSIVAVPSEPDATGKRQFVFHHIEWWDGLMD